MIRTRRLMVACLVAAVALGAGASAAAAAPYTLTSPSPGALAATASGSTMALTIHRVGSTIEIVPGTASAPFGCFGDSAKVTCFNFTYSEEIALAGDTLQVEVSDVDTKKLTLVGAAQSDSLRISGPGPLDSGSIGDLALSPGAGNDFVTVGGKVGTITMTGSGDGDDRFTIDSTTLAVGTLSLGNGTDIASSRSSNLTLDGGAGNDTLSGTGPLVGGAGSDLLQPTALGTAVTGGNDAFDLDRLSYRLLPTGVMLTKPSATEVKAAGDAVVKTGVDQVEGGPGNDTITGMGGPDVLLGGGGDDILDGRGGGDILDGGSGFNTVTYESGPTPVNVNLVAGTGTAAGVVDTLASIRGVVTGPGNDVVTGGSADETISLGAGDDVVDGGDGNDTIDAGTANDTLRGGDGSDRLTGGDGADTATYDERTASEPVTVTLATAGGDGAAGENDTLAGVENVTGGASSDTLIGDAGPNALLGGPGLNTMDGLEGDDVIRGGDARDTIAGGKGRDQLFGEGDDDSINAFDGEADVVSCGASLDDDAQVDAGDQVDGCEFSSRGDVPVPVDGDGDGFVGGFDCNDANKGISPAAVDVPGDRIDQDCDGFDEAVPFVDYGLKLGFSRETTAGRLVTQFVVTKLPADHRVLIRCKGSTRSVARRCPFRTATRKPSASGQVALTSLFKRRRLRPGTTIEMQVTAPKFNGRVLRIVIRKGRPTRQDSLCIVAPRKTASRCPDGDE